MIDSITPADELATIFPADSISLADAAALLRVNVSTAHRYAASGRLATFRVGGKLWTTRSACRDFVAVSNGKPATVRTHTRAFDSACNELRAKGLMR